MHYHKIDEALDALKNGEVILVLDDETRENEGDFIVLAEHATPQAINFMASYGKGLICMPISESIAQRAKLHPMVTDNTDNHCTAFTVSVDAVTCTTGISAYERADTVKTVIDPNVKPEQLRRPGHMFPLVAKDGGVLVRDGHTEATVDLARLCGSVPAGLCCEIMAEDGHMMREKELFTLAEKFNLKIINIPDLVKYMKNK